jgi:hypothetical protein
MFTNLNTDPGKRPRLLGELGHLSHTRVSSAEYKYSKGIEIYGEAESQITSTRSLRARFEATSFYPTVAARLARFIWLTISSAWKMAISIVSQPKPSSTLPLVS